MRAARRDIVRHFIKTCQLAIQFGQGMTYILCFQKQRLQCALELAQRRFHPQ